MQRPKAQFLFKANKYGWSLVKRVRDVSHCKDFGFVLRELGSHFRILNRGET